MQRPASHSGPAGSPTQSESSTQPPVLAPLELLVSPADELVGSSPPVLDEPAPLEPSEPDELSDHDLLAFVPLPRFGTWTLTGPDGQSVELSPTARLTSNNLLAIREAAIAGADVVSAYVREPDDGGDRLVMRGNHGFPAGTIGAVRLGFGEGLTGLCAECLRPVSVAVGSADSHFKLVPGLGEERFPAYLGVPLTTSGRALGVLVLQRRAPAFGREKAHQQIVRIRRKSNRARIREAKLRRHVALRLRHHFAEDALPLAIRQQRRVIPRCKVAFVRCVWPEVVGVRREMDAAG